MTALRERMMEDLQLHGFAEKTQEAYLRAVRQLGLVLQKATGPDHRGRAARIFSLPQN